jgi:hypothetical protein
MLTRFVTLGLVLPALAFSARRIDLATTEKTDFAPGGTVRIEGSTDELNIEGWDEPAVEVQVVRYSWSDREDRAKKALERIQVTKQLSGHELTITTVHKRFTDAHVDYRIRVPRNTNLTIHHGVGDITIYGVAGNIDARAKDGDVVVQLPEPAKYAIDAYTRLGSIYSDFDGAHHPHLKTSETLKVAGEGAGETRQIHLRVGGAGGITIQKVAAQPLLSLN